jgi:hypothetical protein
LADIQDTIRDVFGVPLSVEGVPKESEYAVAVTQKVPPFPIEAGESLGDVLERFEDASEHIYRFDLIRRIPIIRANPEILKERNLLDSVIDLKLENHTIWDALCVLARTVNRKVVSDGGEALSIELNGPQFMELPAPVFLEDPAVSIDLVGVTAREALCAILESAASKNRFNYYYYDYPDEYDFVSVLASDMAGRVIHGEQVRDVKKLDHWSTDYIRKLQQSDE